MIAAACCLWRAFAYPRERKAWLAIGLGMVSFATAELYYTIVLEPRGDDIPYPSLADALYLGLYPCCFVGLLLLARCRAGRLPWMLWVDGLIVAFGFAAVASALVYGRVLDSTGGDPLTVATNLAYPMSDVLLLGLVAGPARRVRPARLARVVGGDLRLRPARRGRHHLPLARRERQLRGRRRARRRLAGRHGARRRRGLAAAGRASTPARSPTAASSPSR